VFRTKSVSARRGLALFALATTPLAFSGCGLTAGGPSCQQFLQMSEADQTSAVINWARKHDNRVDPKDPNSGLSGFALFQDRGSLITYCQDPNHSGDHLGNLVPTG